MLAEDTPSDGDFHIKVPKNSARFYLELTDDVTGKFNIFSRFVVIIFA